MNNLTLNTKDILLILARLDEQCRSQGTQAELMLLGASAIKILCDLKGMEFRSTRDIDVNIVAASSMEEIRHLLLINGIDIVGGVIDVPPMEDFVEGTKFLINSNYFTNIRVFVPTIELLACSKIFSTRGKDLEDLKESDILKLCDIPKLMEMIDEYKEYALNKDDLNLNLVELPCILKEKGL